MAATVAVAMNTSILSKHHLSLASCQSGSRDHTKTVGLFMEISRGLDSWCGLVKPAAYVTRPMISSGAW